MMVKLKTAVEHHYTCNPGGGGDLLRTVCQARENGLKIKWYGGTFPANAEGADVLVSLSKMKRIVYYDPDEQTFTVETGITIKELLRTLEYLNFTLELYGILPNMAIGDAINVGLIGSSGSMAHCLKSCQVLHPDGTLLDWVWPGVEKNPEHPVNLKEGALFPSLQTLVCGLGVVGVITMATVQCVPVHLAQEYTYECCSDQLSDNWPQLSNSLYANIYWYPLLDKAIVKCANPGRVQLAFSQPWWKKCLELIMRGLHWAVYSVSPFLSWYFPLMAKSLSRLQFNLLMQAFSYRANYCFQPQELQSVKSYSRGLKWVLPSDRLSTLLADVETWAEERFNLCSTPLIMSLQTHPAHDLHKPFLAPYNDKQTCTVWSNWFSNHSISMNYSATMAEFESLLQQNKGRKCWSAGPVFVSPLIGQMYPGFRSWCDVRSSLDPSGMLRSAYVEGDLFVEKN